MHCLLFLFLQKQSSLDRSPRLLGSRMLSRLRSQASRLSYGRSRGSTWASGSSYISVKGGTGSLDRQQTFQGLMLEPKGEPRRGRGRGVRLRGGGAGRGITGGGTHAQLEDESEDSSSSSNSSSSEEGEEEEEDSGLKNGRGGDKENQPHSRQGGQVVKERDEDGSEMANQNGGGQEEEMDQDSPKGDKNGSHLKVTLQRPSRAKQNPSAIVPKLEAVSSQTPTSTIHNQSRALVRPPIRNYGPFPDQHPSRQTSHMCSGHTDSNTFHPERLKVSKRLSRPAKLNNGASASSSSELHHLRVPLSPLQEGGSEADRESIGSSPSCEREVWVSVFRYLSRADLCVCMAVCKNWYKW